MKSCSEAVLLDVRTAEEFEKGHLSKALNIDWNGDDFVAKIAPLDKSKPIFIYCLSGARSAAAAAKMRSDGFKTVVELQGGILKWRASNLPETKGDPVKTAGMSQPDFEALLKTEKLVLIDFYADWCAPCKKMAPYLEEIKAEMAEKVSVVRINADVSLRPTPYFPPSFISGFLRKAKIYVNIKSKKASSSPGIGMASVDTTL
jgi:rhodanese-related sulfurtransferase